MARCHVHAMASRKPPEPGTCLAWLAGCSWVGAGSRDLVLLRDVGPDGVGGSGWQMTEFRHARQVCLASPPDHEAALAPRRPSSLALRGAALAR